MKSFYLKPKFFESIKSYNKSQFAKDVVAGIIVAIIALPLSIALTLASGLDDPTPGIYTAILAGFIVALMGGSRVQIAGPTAAFATIVAGIISDKGMSGLIIATLMSGIILIIMGICKAGSLIKHVPKTVTVGFTGGIAVTIFLGQIKDFLGITYTSNVKPETFHKMEANIHNISSFDWQSFVIGIISLAILIIYPKFEKRVPPSLIAVIIAALLVKFVPIFSNEVSTIGSLYQIQTGLPKFTLGNVDFNLNTIISLIPNAFIIAFLAGIESLLSCVVADGMIDDKHNPNAELVAQGLGNMASVAFGGIPATGAIARTAANIKNGGKSAVSGMVHSIVLLLVVLFLMPYAKLIPMPAIAAILFMVAYNMSEWRSFVKIVKTKNFTDILIMVLTFVLTVAKDLVVAIVVGLALHFIIVLIKKIGKKA